MLLAGNRGQFAEHLTEGSGIQAGVAQRPRNCTRVWVADNGIGVYDIRSKRRREMDIREEGKPFSAKGTNGVGCLVMQGFTGTVGSIRYYAEQLAAKGLSVEAPRLTGHGTQWRDANKVRYTDWIRDAEQAYQSLAGRCDKVFVTGLSMGGTLILYLAEHHPEIAGVIPVNAPVFMTDKRVPFLPILKHLIASTPAIASDIMEPGIIEPAYDRTPTAGAHEMVKLLGVTCCLLYTSDAADDLLCVDLGGRRIIKKK